MKYARFIKLTAFSFESEYNNVLAAFLRFFPFDLGSSKVALKKTSATGFNGKKIGIIKASLTKNSLITDFLGKLLGSLDLSQKSSILQ